MQSAIELCLKSFDEKFYLDNYPNIKNASPFDHFMSIGAFEGRSPNKDFDVPTYFLSNLDVLKEGFNPLLHFFAHGRHEGRTTSEVTLPFPLFKALNNGKTLNYTKLLKKELDPILYQEELNKLFPIYSGKEINVFLHYVLMGWKISPHLIKLVEFNSDYEGVLNPIVFHHFQKREVTSKIQPKIESIEVPIYSENVKAYFDVNYYLNQYPDVKKAGVDPFKHFCTNGWRELRNPSNDFNTRFYLDEYKYLMDDPDENPLDHYMRIGLSHNLKTSPAKWQEIELIKLNENSEVNDAHKNEVTISIKNLVSQIKKGGSIFSFSHDMWHQNTGGIQLFIKREVALARKKGFDCYVHFSPRNYSKISSDKDQLLNCSINQKYIGTIALSELLQNYKFLSGPIVIHSLLGYSGKILSLFGKIPKNKINYYLHDHFQVCENYNLLRNNIEYCGAPSPASVECMVCKFGVKREARIRRFRKFFTSTSLNIISPSPSAAEIFRKTFPDTSVEILPHYSLSKSSKRVKKNKVIKIAYIGGQQAQKGWGIFQELALTLGGQKTFQLYHITSSGKTDLPNTLAVQASTTKNPLDTIHKLKENNIDIVFIPSIWPETFSYVAAEALISGCSILCFKDSGNVNALVKAHSQGYIFDDESDFYQKINEQKIYDFLNGLVKGNHYHDFSVNAGIFNDPNLSKLNNEK